MAKGGALRAKRMQRGKRANAIKPVRLPEVHQALGMVYWAMYW